MSHKLQVKYNIDKGPVVVLSRRRALSQIYLYYFSLFEASVVPKQSCAPSNYHKQTDAQKPSGHCTSARKCIGAQTIHKSCLVEEQQAPFFILWTIIG